MAGAANVVSVNGNKFINREQCDLKGCPSDHVITTGVPMKYFTSKTKIKFFQKFSR